MLIILRCQWCTECTIYKDAAAPAQQDREDLQESGASWDQPPPTDAFSRLSVTEGVSSGLSSVVGGSSGVGSSGIVSGQAQPYLYIVLTKCQNYGQPSHITNSLTFGQGVAGPRPPSGTEYLPPHLRPVAPSTTDNDIKIVSSVSNDFLNTETETATSDGGEGGWRVRGAAANRRQAQIPFTAYAPDGSAHPHVTSGPAFTNGMKPPPPESSGTRTTHPSAWSRPAATSNRPPTTTPAPTNGRKGWARAVSIDVMLQ